MATKATEVPGDDARPLADDSVSDRSLLRLYRHGDQNAATRIYRRYADRLRKLARSKRSPALARRVDDDEIVQSVFGSFFRRVNLGIYDVPEGKDLWRLFLVLTVNKVRAIGEFHRAEKRDVGLTVGEDVIDHSAETLATDGQAYEALRVAVDEALDRLPAEHRRVIRLRMEGYEVEEISKSIGRSKRTVERILQQGLERLATRLDG